MQFCLFWIKIMRYIVIKDKEAITKTTCKLAALCEACSQKARNWKSWVTLVDSKTGSEDHYSYFNDRTSEVELLRLFDVESLDKLDIDMLYREYISFNFTDEEVLKACHKVGFNVTKSTVARWKKAPSNVKYKCITANEFLLLYKQSQKNLIGNALSKDEKILMEKKAKRDKSHIDHI